MIHKHDGRIYKADVRDQRISAGTIGTDHHIPSSVTSRSLNTIITPLDRSITYSANEWSFGAGSYSLDFLGYLGFSNIPGAYLEVPFNGTNIAVVGDNLPSGGRADFYIDGELANGAINATGILNVIAYGHEGLSDTDDTISVNENGLATIAPSSGTLIIDGEQINYSAVDTSPLAWDDFTGCTRGANGTVASRHNAGATVAAASSAVEFYTSQYQNRITLWTKRDLDPGSHVLKIIVRPDADGSSSGTDIYLSGFILGGMAGASNLNTNTRFISIAGVDIDTTGVSTDGYTLSPDNSSEQLLGILGVQKEADLTVPVGYMWDSAAAQLYITGPPSTTIDVIVTTINLGPSI